MEKNSAGINNIIGEGTHISGKVFVPGSVRVDGQIDGEITVSEMLTVGKTGNLKGTINTKDAVIGGIVDGKLIVKNRVELQKTAKVNIDLVCKYLIVEEGVIFDGTCSMSKQELFDKNAKGKTE